jgi:YggT family protein
VIEFGVMYESHCLFINFILDTVLQCYSFSVFAYLILRWLSLFSIINANNRIVSAVGEFLRQIVEPVLNIIRRKIPPIGSVDISPLILFIVIHLLRVILSL